MRDFNEFMKEQGYTGPVADSIYANEEVTYWYKKVPGTVHHQVIVRRWPSVLGSLGPQYEVEMTYETRHEIWSTNKYYGLSESKLVKFLDGMTSRLKDALLYMDANPLHYRFDGEN